MVVKRQESNSKPLDPKSDASQLKWSMKKESTEAERKIEREREWWRERERERERERYCACI